jgi:hypothetical protein
MRPTRVERQRILDFALVGHFALIVEAPFLGAVDLGAWRYRALEENALKLPMRDIPCVEHPVSFLWFQVRPS